MKEHGGSEAEFRQTFCLIRKTVQLIIHLDPLLYLFFVASRAGVRQGESSCVNFSTLCVQLGCRQIVSNLDAGPLPRTMKLNSTNLPTCSFTPRLDQASSSSLPQRRSPAGDVVLVCLSFIFNTLHTGEAADRLNAARVWNRNSYPSRKATVANIRSGWSLNHRRRTAWTRD